MPYDAVSEDMLKIFDNAIIWAAGIYPLAPPETEPVTEEPEIVDEPSPVDTLSPQTADVIFITVSLAAGAISVSIALKKKK